MAANPALPWTLYTELVVGRGHPSFTDTDNRALRQFLTASGFAPDNPFYGISLGAFTYNAASFPGATREAQINAAIVQAGADAASTNKGNYYVWIPRSMLPYDARLVTFNNAAVNGVEMLREGGPTNSFDVVAYGAAANGIQDDSTAILAAGAAANARVGGGTVYFSDFGANVYLVNSPLTFNAYTDVSFIGQGGPNQTRIIMGVAGAHCMNFTGVCSRITIRDLWLGTNTVALASGIGLSIVGTVGTHSDRFSVEHVTIQNTPSPLRLQYLDNSTFRDVAHYQNVAAATTGPVFSMNTTISCYFYSCYNVVSVGTLPAEVWLIDYDTDTLIFFACQALFAGTHGWLLQQSAGTTGPRLIRLTDCYGESSVQNGFRVDAGRDVRLNGCHAAVNTLAGFFVNGGTSVTVTDCFSVQNGTHGIWVAAGTGVKLDGNTCSNNSQTANNTSYGIVIGANGTRIVGNRSGDFVFALANKQAAGLVLQGGTDFLFVGANDLQGNLGPGFSQPIINSSTGANNEFYGSRFLTPSEAVLVAGADLEACAQINIEVTLTAARLVGALFNVFKGQRVTFTFIQSGAGAFAVTWNAVYKTSWADAGNATPKRSSIAYVYDGTNWNQDGAQTPYV